jgi:hypothetical protein
MYDTSTVVANPNLLKRNCTSRCHFRVTPYLTHSWLGRFIPRRQTDPTAPLARRGDAKNAKNARSWRGLCVESYIAHCCTRDFGVKAVQSILFYSLTTHTTPTDGLRSSQSVWNQYCTKPRTTRRTCLFRPLAFVICITPHESVVTMMMMMMTTSLPLIPSLIDKWTVSSS